MSGADYVPPYSDEQDSIDDDAILYRRIHPDHILWDQAGQERAPPISKSAFGDYPEDRALALGCPGPAMSVHLASVLRTQGREPGDLLQSPSYGLVRLTAGDVRSYEQGVQYWPTDEDESHAVVFSKNGRKRTKSQEKKVRDSAEWVIVPPSP